MLRVQGPAHSNGRRAGEHWTCAFWHVGQVADHTRRASPASAWQHWGKGTGPRRRPCPCHCRARSPEAAGGCAVQLGPKVPAVIRLHNNHRQRHGRALAGGGCRAGGHGGGRFETAAGSCRPPTRTAQAGRDGACKLAPCCCLALIAFLCLVRTASATHSSTASAVQPTMMPTRKAAAAQQAGERRQRGQVGGQGTRG